MNIPKAWRATGLVLLCIAALLPVAGRNIRTQTRGCDLDGLRIDYSRRVRLINSEGESHQFCSIKCAELWLHASNQKPSRILVTDEVDGGEIESKDAHFVSSSVISHAPTNDRRHVFAKRADAEAHAETFRGRVLADEQLPFGLGVLVKG